MAKKRFMKEGSLQLVMFIDLGSSFFFIILGSGYEIASSFEFIFCFLCQAKLSKAGRPL